MPMFFVLAILLLIFASFWLKRWMEAERERLQLLEVCSQKYAAKMRAILSSDVQWDDWALSKLARCNGIAGSKVTLFALLLTLNVFNKKNQKKTPISVDKRREQFFAKYPEMEEKFTEVSVYAVLTVFYSNGLLWHNLADNVIKSMKKNPSEPERLLRLFVKGMGILG